MRTWEEVGEIGAGGGWSSFLVGLVRRTTGDGGVEAEACLVDVEDPLEHLMIHSDLPSTTYMEPKTKFIQ